MGLSPEQALAIQQYLNTPAPMPTSGLGGQLLQGALQGLTGGIYDPATSNKGQLGTAAGNVIGNILGIGGATAVGGLAGGAGVGSLFGAGQELRAQSDEIESGIRQDPSLARAGLAALGGGVGAALPAAPSGLTALQRAAIGALGGGAAIGGETAIGNALDPVQRDVALPTLFGTLVGAGAGAMGGAGARGVDEALTNNATIKALTGQDIPLLPEHAVHAPTPHTEVEIVGSRPLNEPQEQPIQNTPYALPSKSSYRPDVLPSQGLGEDLRYDYRFGVDQASAARPSVVDRLLGIDAGVNEQAVRGQMNEMTPVQTLEDAATLPQQATEQVVQSKLQPETYMTKAAANKALKAANDARKKTDPKATPLKVVSDEGRYRVVEAGQQIEVMEPVFKKNQEIEINGEKLKVKKEPFGMVEVEDAKGQRRIISREEAQGKPLVEEAVSGATAPLTDDNVPLPELPYQLLGKKPKKSETRPYKSLGKGIYAIADSDDLLTNLPETTVLKAGRQPEITFNNQKAKVTHEHGDYLKLKYEDGNIDFVHVRQLDNPDAYINRPRGKKGGHLSEGDNGYLSSKADLANTKGLDEVFPEGRTVDKAEFDSLYEGIVDDGGTPMSQRFANKTNVNPRKYAETYLDVVDKNRALPEDSDFVYGIEQSYFDAGNRRTVSESLKRTGTMDRVQFVPDSIHFSTTDDFGLTWGPKRPLVKGIDSKGFPTNYVINELTPPRDSNGNFIRQPAGFVEEPKVVKIKKSDIGYGENRQDVFKQIDIGPAEVDKLIKDVETLAPKNKAVQQLKGMLADESTKTDKQVKKIKELVGKLKIKQKELMKNKAGC